MWGYTAGVSRPPGQGGLSSGGHRPPMHVSQLACDETVFISILGPPSFPFSAVVEEIMCSMCVFILQAEQELRRDNSGRSWGASGASPGSHKASFLLGGGAPSWYYPPHHFILLPATAFLCLEMGASTIRGHPPRPHAHTLAESNTRFVLCV